jgi:hypothetical protein
MRLGEVILGLSCANGLLWAMAFAALIVLMIVIALTQR